MQIKTRLGRGAGLVTGLVLAGVLAGCEPVTLGAAMGSGVLVATDRRSAGTQLEDQTIELRAMSELGNELDKNTRIIVTSYNRRVLLTGDIAAEADRKKAVQIVSAVENVVQVVDELQVRVVASLSERSADSLTTARVKGGLIDAKDMFANAFKIVTERGTVYMMGRVTQREADRATQIARSTTGVKRVVRVLDIISEAELARMLPKKTGDAE